MSRAEWEHGSGLPEGTYLLFFLTQDGMLMPKDSVQLPTLHQLSLNLLIPPWPPSLSPRRARRAARVAEAADHAELWLCSLTDTQGSGKPPPAAHKS